MATKQKVARKGSKAKSPSKKRVSPKANAAHEISAKRAKERSRLLLAGKPMPRAAVVSGAREAHVISFEEAGTDPAETPSSPEYAWRILAEGDSWFTLGALPATNLLNELRFPRSVIIVNAGYPGDTIRHMAEISDNLPLRRMLVERNFAYEWDALLVSGGGNDLIDAAKSLIVARPPAASPSDEPQDYVDLDRLRTLIRDVQRGYRELAALRDASSVAANRDIPIIAHRYDYPTARNSPAAFLFVPVRGPWLYPALNQAGIQSAELRQAIVDYLLTALGDGIAALTSGPHRIENFHVVNTRGLLNRASPSATGPSGDWENEIHPTALGYRKLARKFEEKLEQLLG